MREAGTMRSLDWGTERFLTLGTGEVIDNARFLRAEAARLHRAWDPLVAASSGLFFGA